MKVQMNILVEEDFKVAFEEAAKQNGMRPGEFAAATLQAFNMLPPIQQREAVLNRNELQPVVAEDAPAPLPADSSGSLSTTADAASPTAAGTRTSKATAKNR